MVNPYPGKKASETLKPKKMLIVYDEIPEATTWFVVETTSEIAPIVRKIAGLAANCDKLTKEQDKAFDRFFKWRDSADAKAAKREAKHLKVRIHEVVRVIFFL